MSEDLLSSIGTEPQDLRADDSEQRVKVSVTGRIVPV
jgi:hypothetical protein